MSKDTKKVKYILDKNIHIKLEKLINDDKLTKSGLSLLEKFVNINVSRTIPKISFGKFSESDFAVYSSIGKKLINEEVTTIFPVFFQIQSTGGKIYPQFNYFTEDNKGCEEIGIQEFGKVEEDDIELINKTLREENILVTDDVPAQKPCLALGVKVINFDNFIKMAKIKKYFK